jgi:phosphate acetyltransferase
MEILERIREQARKRKKTIVLPEAEDDRTLRAAEQLKKELLCEPILISKNDLRDRAETLQISLEGIRIIDPEQSEDFEGYVDTYCELRQHKGISKDHAVQMLKNPLFYGAMMVRKGEADGSVAGAMNTTGDVLRAAIQCIGLAKDISIVSSIFLMIVPGWDRAFSYADGAVVPDPDPEQLASIAIASAKTHQRLTGEEPVVAMLSFSTYSSADHPMVDKVKEATRIAKASAPELTIDGELQVDAALIPSIAEKKAKGSPVNGNANVLVFPDLNAGNIAYKITQRLAGADAIGPIIQGLDKPANDLSRGCSVEDIINVAAICSLLA